MYSAQRSVKVGVRRPPWALERVVSRIDPGKRWADSVLKYSMQLLTISNAEARLPSKDSRLRRKQWRVGGTGRTK